MPARQLPAMKLLSVNVGRVRPIAIGARTVASAITKQAAAGRVSVHPLGLGGDEQADLSVHGGLSKAVYAYPAEHLAFWRTVRAQSGKRSTSPIQAACSSKPSSVRFSPRRPGAGASSQRATPACARTVRQKARHGR